MMSRYTTPPMKSHSALLRRIVELAWPVLIAQLSSMTQMVSDTVLAGRYGTEDLAAVAVASGIYISIVMLMVGILQAVAPTVAHLFGAGRLHAIGPALQQGFWLALMLAVPGTLVLGYPEHLLQLARVPPDIAKGAGAYMQAAAFGLPAVLLYRTFYAFNNAVGRPRVLMAISFVVTATHIPLAWALTNGLFGFAGLPALGGTGCGVSTAIVAWLGLICGFTHLVRSPAYRPYAIFFDWRPPRLREIGGENKLVKQIIDLALLSNGLLKGKNLTEFIQRSISLIEK